MKILLRFSVLLLFLVFSCKSQKDEFSQLFPTNDGALPVFDSSNLFTTAERLDLSKKLIAYKDETSRQIVVVTLDSITPYHDIQKYASDLGNFWGVGEKDKDNGLILVLSKPLRKVAIATGYGTEKVLTDSICKIIIDSVMTPLFKNDEYYKGIDQGIDTVIEKWTLTE